MLHKKEWCTCDRCGKYIEAKKLRRKMKSSEKGRDK